MQTPGDKQFWETRSFLLLAMALSIVPLLWPAIPPLNDLPGHIGRYHVATSLSHSADLQRHWSYDWALISNLGVDLLVMPLAPLLGVEGAAKLVVITIPPLMIAGLAALSREAGGRLSPAAPIAFTLAYSYPFQLGFVNFMLAGALALLALALWMRMGRLGQTRARAFLFVPISLILWLVHSFGWGMFGLFAFATEIDRMRRAGTAWPNAIIHAGIFCAALTLPLALMIAIGGSGDGLAISYEWVGKLSWVASLMRERWEYYDLICAFAIFCFLWTALRVRAFGFDTSLAVTGLVGLAAVLILPYRLMGGAYVDMRMLPFAIAILLVGVRTGPGHARIAKGIALGATLLFLLRTTTTTAALALAAQGQEAAMRIIPSIPRGASVLVLVKSECSSWDEGRLGHVAGIALARRDIFDNSEWTLPNQQLLRSKNLFAREFSSDPSQLIYPLECAYRPADFDVTIRDFDRRAFQYVWTVGFAPRPALASDVVLFRSDGPSTIYRVR